VGSFNLLSKPPCPFETGCATLSVRVDRMGRAGRCRQAPHSFLKPGDKSFCGPVRPLSNCRASGGGGRARRTICAENQGRAKLLPSPAEKITKGPSFRRLFLKKFLKTHEKLDFVADDIVSRSKPTPIIDPSSPQKLVRGRRNERKERKTDVDLPDGISPTPHWDQALTCNKGVWNKVSNRNSLHKTATKLKAGWRGRREVN